MYWWATNEIKISLNDFCCVTYNDTEKYTFVVENSIDVALCGLCIQNEHNEKDSNYKSSFLFYSALIN